MTLSSPCVFASDVLHLLYQLWI